MNVKHIPPEDMKKKVLRFRVTDEEHERLMQQAKSKGYNTFSDYIRDLINKDNTSNDKNAAEERLDKWNMI